MRDQHVDRASPEYAWPRTDNGLKLAVTNSTHRALQNQIESTPGTANESGETSLHEFDVRQHPRLVEE